MLTIINREDVPDYTDDEYNFLNLFIELYVLYAHREPGDTNSCWYYRAINDGCTVFERHVLPYMRRNIEDRVIDELGEKELTVYDHIIYCQAIYEYCSANGIRSIFQLPLDDIQEIDNMIKQIYQTEENKIC